MPFRKSGTNIFLIAALAFLLLCGIYLRFHQLGTQSYWMDEGYTINAVQSIMQKGVPVLDSGESYSCPLYCYPTAWIAKIAGESAQSYRFLAALAGVLFILAIFFVIQKLFNRSAALLTAAMIAFSYYQIAWSRQARWYTLYELLLWLAIFFYLQWMTKRGNKWANGALTALFAALAAWTHNIGLLLPVLMLAWFVLVLAKGNKKFLWLPAVLLPLAIVLVPLFSIYFQNIHFAYNLPYWSSFFFRNYWPFIILSLVALLNRKREVHQRHVLYFLFFVFLSYFAAFSFLTDTVEYRYLFALTPVFYIGAALGFIDIIGKIRHIYVRYILGLVLGILFFVGGFGVWHPLAFYALEADDPALLPGRSYYAYTPQPDWNGAYKAILEQRQPGDIVISTQPQFNKIFLGEAGYWIEYNYLGAGAPTTKVLPNGTEYYVGAQVVSGLAELKQLVITHHGYVVFDYMALDGRIPTDIQDYIVNTGTQVFYEKTNSYSQVWVYKF